MKIYSKNIHLQEIAEKTNECVIEPSNFYTSKRFLLAILIFLGQINISIPRMNFNIAIVEMIPVDKNVTAADENDTKFHWNTRTREFILSLIFYGNAFSFIGGIMAPRIGGTKIFGFMIACSALITIFTPLLIHTNLLLFCTFRFIMGICQVSAIVSVTEIWSRWAPPNERAILTSISETGFSFGIMVAYPLAGYLTKLYGWSMVFYITGVIPLIWCILWFILVKDDPANDKLISKIERQYLAKIINRKINDKVIYCWRSIFMSKVVWAFLIAKFANYYAIIIVSVRLPQYIKDASGVNISEIGLLSAIPQICSIFGSIPVSYLLDYLQRTKKLDSSSIHKIFICMGYTTAGILYSILSFLGFIESLICISLQNIVICFSEVSLRIIAMDFAPRYACVINGIGMSFSFIAAILAPTIIELTLKNHNVTEWRHLFISLGSVFFISAVLYLLFGSSELQAWSLPAKETQKETINRSDCEIKKY